MALLVAACDSSSPPDVGDAPEHESIDVQSGAYRGVGIDDGPADVERVFGTPPKHTRSPGLTPHGREHREISLAPRAVCFREGRHDERYMVYRLVAFALRDDRLCRFMVIEDGAATGEGVAIGDPLSEAEDGYSDVECGEVESELGFLEYRYCEAQVAADRHVWFGGDPIDTIEVSEARFVRD